MAAMLQPLLVFKTHQVDVEMMTIEIQYCKRGLMFPIMQMFFRYLLV